MSSHGSQTGFVATPTGAEAGIVLSIRKDSNPQSTGYKSPLSGESVEGVLPGQTRPLSHSPPCSRHTPPRTPPRRTSTELQELPIDPSLSGPNSDGTADLQTARPIETDFNEGSSPDQPAADPDSLRPIDLSDASRHVSLPPWQLQTSGLILDSQPPTSASSSPATPGQDGLYLGETFDTSRHGSTTDFESFVGATKGFSTAASSESDFDPGDRHGDGSGGTGGIPPPRPKKSHARKQPEGHIKRARNAFILFRKHVTDSNLIPPSVEVKHQNISVVAAKMWREAPQEVRQKFQEQARIEKEEHAKKYPGYRYQPVFRRTDIIRRRVRKDPAEDEKVDAVAEALIKGKTGLKLEEEIKEQMVTRGDASESEEEARTSSGARRRRREVGQLSKGAIRAQRAQARQKQMRQNLLGSNLLNISLYNAANQNRMLNHPGAQHYSQYAMSDQYLPSVQGYDIDGNPLMYTDTQGAGAMYPGDLTDAGEMYRLPPIDGMGMVYDDSQGPYRGLHGHPPSHAAPGWADPHSLGANDFGGGDYWGGGEADYHAIHDPNQDYYAGMSAAEYDQMHPSQYQLAPMMNPPAGMPQDVPPLALPEDSRDRQPELAEWERDGQQTPSGHVLFNERLFDGALGSASLPTILGDRDDGLAGFDEAMAQASEIPQW